ncbi:MAG TPA: ABC transporter permease [Arachnia sp.]|nr:ABC transporter permease [Arachnia sp.]HMT86563.1 ABC transporter permease [Arachnia sp.]
MSDPRQRPPTPARPGRGGGGGALVLAPLVFVAVAIVVWEIAVRATGVRPQVLPPPSRVADAGWGQREAILDHALATLSVTAAGFGLSLVLAWAIAVAADFSPTLRRGVMPLLVASQTIPVIAIAPLVVIWFGFGLWPKMLVVSLVTFFPLVVGLVEGFASAPAEASGLLRSMGAGPVRTFLLVRLPSALPSFFTALRIGITYAVTGAIFAEYVGARRGLGIYMSVQKNAFRTDLVLAAVAVTAVVSVGLYLSTYLVERLVIPWHVAQRKAVAHGA